MLAAGTVCVLAICSCAEVKVQKVPTPTQYVHWTDEMQQQADEMEGIRYYLPRPFVHVKESFPVRTDIYLADGVVSPDGQYVLLKSVRPESGLAMFSAGMPDEVRIPTRDISKPTAEDITAQAGVVRDMLAGAIRERDIRVPTGTDTAAAGTAPLAVPSPPAAAPPSPAPAPAPITGISERKVTNDNNAFAFQPLGANFDIVYMPDFKEQYAVSSEAGLGNVEFEVNLGQGWSLQGFNSLSDNSELNKRIFDFIDTSTRLAKSLAAKKFGIPLAELAPGLTGAVTPQAGEESLTGGTPGTPVSLKIVVVHYAAKGLYPIIKPREIQERIAGQENSYCFLDLFKLNPKVMGVSDADPDAIARAQQAIENVTGAYSVPRYPYQYISFNTFRYMAIEVIKPTTPAQGPFEYLYPETGTAAAPGGREATALPAVAQQVVQL